MKIEKEHVKLSDRIWFIIKKHLSKSNFISDIVAILYSLKDPSTPFWNKLILYSSLLYLISPIDFLPDFFVVLGITDDAAAIVVAYKILLSNVKNEHRQKAKLWFNNQISPTKNSKKSVVNLEKNDWREIP